MNVRDAGQGLPQVARAAACGGAHVLACTLRSMRTLIRVALQSLVVLLLAAMGVWHCRRQRMKTSVAVPPHGQARSDVEITQQSRAPQVAWG